MEYENILNFFDCGATTKLTVIIRRLNKEELKEAVFIPMQNDQLDQYRKEVNDMLMEKTVGANGMIRELYVTISVYRKNVEDAKNYFLRTGNGLISHFSNLGSKCEELDAQEKLHVLYSFYRAGEEGHFCFDMKTSAKLGHSFKDYICPDTMEFEKDYFKVGERYGRVLYLKDYASYIPDTMVSEFADINQNMMISIDIIPIPTDEAVNEAQNRLLGVETKVLDKTLTAAEHLKDAYIRTRDSADQTQVKEQDSLVGYAEDQVMGQGERAACGTVQQAEKQGKRVIQTVRKKGEIRTEAEAFRESSSSSFSSGSEGFYQPKEQMKNQTGMQSGKSFGRKNTAGKMMVKEEGKIREFPKQAIKTAEKGEKTVKTIPSSVQISGKTIGKGIGRTIKTAKQTGYTAIHTSEVSARATVQGTKVAVLKAQRTAFAARQAAIAAAQATKATAKAVAHAVKAVIAALKTLISAIIAGGWIVVLILLIVILFGGLLSMVGGSNASTVTQVSAEVEAYEPLIRQYARQHGIEEYVELIKAVMMQESGGQGTDPMQASECGYNTRYPNTPNGIPDPEYSIDVGIQNFAACLREAEVESPLDMNNIKLALQGYNYGNGYISWAKENYGGYTYANAVEFSTMMTERNGWSSYGDKEYVSHVLRYYVFGRIPTGIGNQAIVQVALTQEGNGGGPYWSWYGFSSRVEWCACFVSWCADQCGYIESGVIPKFSLCSAGMEWFESRGQFMDGSYVPTSGDLIFFDWGNDGNIDHVGIVESVVDGTVYTMEGNSGDKVVRRDYPIGYEQIEGYGVACY